MLPPALFLHGNERKHINRRFKQIEPITLSVPVKAKFRLAAGHIAFVAALGTSPALVGVLCITIGIEAYKDCVVVVCRFINHAFMNKGIQHLLVDSPAIQEIGEHPPHIIVLRRQYKWFFFLLHRR